MGADNWTHCPRCKAKHREAELVRAEKVAQAYGKVTPEEWDRMRAERLPALEETLREDYEIGINGDEFYASYSAHCTADNCEFSHQFKHEEKYLK